MQITIPLEEMSLEDKLRAMEEIWADLANTQENIPSPSWHAEVLRAREQRISEGATRFMDIAEAKKAVRKRLE